MSVKSQGGSPSSIRMSAIKLAGEARQLAAAGARAGGWHSAPKEREIARHPRRLSLRQALELLSVPDTSTVRGLCEWLLTCFRHKITVVEMSW